MHKLTKPKAEVTKIPGTKIRETDKAILIRLTDTDTPVEEWFPLSTVHEIHPDYIVVDQWIAKKKDLMY